MTQNIFFTLQKKNLKKIIIAESQIQYWQDLNPNFD